MTAILGEPGMAGRRKGATHSAEEREERMIVQLRGYAAMTGNAPL